MDYSKGLSKEDVRLKFENGENNYKVQSSTQTVGEIIKSNVFTYFNLVFLVLAILLAIASAWRDMLFLPIIIAEYTYRNSSGSPFQKVLDNLSILNSPKTKTLKGRTDR